MDGESLKLTAKEQAFIDAYLGKCFLNATRAAIAAGYNPKSAREMGSRLLTKVAIRQRINEELAKNAVPKERILARLARQAEGDFSEMVAEEDGKTIVGLAAAIKNGSTDLIQSYNPSTGQITLYSAQAALLALAKAYGLDGTLGSKQNPVHVEQHTSLTLKQLNEIEVEGMREVGVPEEKIREAIGEVSQD
jgi:hypothetical protein